MNIGVNIGVNIGANIGVNIRVNIHIKEQIMHIHLIKHWWLDIDAPASYWRIRGWFCSHSKGLTTERWTFLGVSIIWDYYA